MPLMAETLMDAVPVGLFTIRGDALTWLGRYLRELTRNVLATTGAIDHGTIFDVKRGHP